MRRLDKKLSGSKVVMFPLNLGFGHVKEEYAVQIFNVSIFLGLPAVHTYHAFVVCFSDGNRGEDGGSGRARGVESRSHEMNGDAQ